MFHYWIQRKSPNMNPWLTAFLLWGYVFQGLSAFRVVCVYTNWSQYRPDMGKFLPEDVDPSLCTHLIYVYAKLQGNKLVASEWNDEGSTWSEGMFDRVQKLKQLNPELKTLLGVGGWMMGSKDFSRMASRAASRRMFAITAVKYLRERDFDGLVIDWQYPSQRGGKPYDRKNFSLLLKEIRRAIEDESKKSSLPSLLLSAGVSASKDIIENAYEIDNVTRYTDFINVLAYDLHGAWDNYTGHPSQLYPRKEEFGPSTDINVDAVMKYWISNVPDRNKLNLGVSTYGRTFTLRKARHNEYNVPTKGPGLAGEHTKQPGMLAYYERCSQYPDATRVWDDFSKAAYWYKGDQWIAGEDVDSIKAKIRWMKGHRVGGITIWSLDTDDFYNTCTNGSYPLLTAVHDELAAPFVPTTVPYTDGLSVTTETVQTTSITSTTPSYTTTPAARPSTTTKITKEPKINKKVVKAARTKQPKKLKQTRKLTNRGSVQHKKEPQAADIANIISKNGNSKQASKPNEFSPKSAPEPKRNRQFPSRNENPNKIKKATSTPIREGNQIVVRRKKVLRRRKNRKKPGRQASSSTPNNRQKDQVLNKIVQKTASQRVSGSGTKANNSRTGKPNAAAINNKRNVKKSESTNESSKDINSTDKSKSNGILDSTDNANAPPPKAEPLKGANTLNNKSPINDGAVNDNTPKGIAKTKNNMAKNDKKKGVAKKKRKGRKVVRKVARKLTKKQMEIRKKRRRQQQRKRRNKARKNKS